MRRWAWCCVVACLVALVPAARASAHSSFLGSDPSDGSVLSTGPTVATLRFSESVLKVASEVRLLDVGGGTWQDLPIESRDDGQTLVATLPAMTRGAYILRFVVVDPADLHRTVGSISFGVGVAAPASIGSQTAGDSLLATILRALADVGLFLVVGAAAIAFLALRSREGLPEAIRLRLLRIGKWATWLTVVMWVALLLVDAVSVGMGNVRWSTLLLGSDPGRRVLIGAQLAVATHWAVRLGGRAREASAITVSTVLAAFAVGLVGTAALGGHTAIGGNELAGFALRALHLLALGGWLGSVALGWWVTRGSTARVGRQLWGCVSRVATVGLVLTGATGLLLSARSVATITALLSTTYGALVVIKIVGLVVLGALGFLATRSIAHGRVPARRALLVELVVMAVLIGVAAALASSVPAVGEQFTPLVAPVPQVITGDVADLTVSASLEPAQPGANLLQVRVLDTRRPAPGAIELVRVRVLDAAGKEVAAVEGTPVDGTLEWDSVTLASPGAYHLEAIIDRPALAVPPFSGQLTVGAPPAVRAETVVSDRPWSPIARLAACAWVVLSGCIGWWFARRRRRLAVRPHLTVAQSVAVDSAA
jgi:methionine-rich copper-binding protein CopC/putative copper export protein